jgi:hypothetical protein
MSLRLGALENPIALAVGFSVGHTCRSPVHVPAEELRQATLLGLQPTRGFQIPDIFIPCRLGDPHRFGI